MSCCNILHGWLVCHGSFADRIWCMWCACASNLSWSAASCTSHFSTVSNPELEYTYVDNIVIRAFGMTKMPSLVVSTASITVRASKPFTTSLQKEFHIKLTPELQSSTPVACLKWYSWKGRASSHLLTQRWHNSCPNGVQVPIGLKRKNLRCWGHQAYPSRECPACHA